MQPFNNHSDILIKFSNPWTVLQISFSFLHVISFNSPFKILSPSNILLEFPSHLCILLDSSVLQISFSKLTVLPISYQILQSLNSSSNILFKFSNPAIVLLISLSYSSILQQSFNYPFHIHKSCNSPSNILSIFPSTSTFNKNPV